MITICGLDLMHYEEDCVFQISAKDRKAQAQKALGNLRDEGEDPQPVSAKARGKIAHSFWGHQWCRNIEAYEDLDYRLVAGRSLLRSGSVVDLKIDGTVVEAKVFDQELYSVTVNFQPLSDDRREQLIASIVGEIDSLVDILSGNFSESVVEKLIDSQNGLFPEINEINLSCNCLDYADMCPHSAAVLYGIGIKFDEHPDLFFGLRSVKTEDLIQTVSLSLDGDDFLAAENSGSQDISSNKSKLENLFDIELI